MKNIILAGLKYDNNLGDQIINELSRRMIDDAWTQSRHTELEIREVDMTGKEGMSYNPTKTRIARSLRFRLYRRLSSKTEAEREEALIRRTVRSVFRNAIDGNTAAIIFGGGGLIKFRQQTLVPCIDEITRLAEEANIPVMFSAVGVEGYDENDPKCLCLKRAINRQAVKLISTRDDLETLKEHYCEGRQLVLRVADPACSVSEWFPRQKEERPHPVIGLGMVREDLFTDYGIDLSEEELLELWTDLYTRLTEKGFVCRAFCNGAKSDERFLLKWAERMGFSEEARGQILIKRPESAEELIRIIQGFDGMIAARLHASIVGFSYGIPFAALVWNNKQLFFGEQIACPERFLERRDFRGEFIVGTLLRALSEGYPPFGKDAYCKTTEAAIGTFLERFV